MNSTVSRSCDQMLERIDRIQKRRSPQSFLKKKKKKFRHFLPIHFADDVGDEKDKREEKNRHGYMEPEKRHDFKPERVGCEERGEVERKRNDDLATACMRENPFSLVK